MFQTYHNALVHWIEMRDAAKDNSQFQPHEAEARQILEVEADNLNMQLESIKEKLES